MNEDFLKDIILNEFCNTIQKGLENDLSESEIFSLYEIALREAQEKLS